MNIFNFNTKKTIREPEQEIPVCAQADVIVVGGGPAGIAAAISASRQGCRTILFERYGHLGGMATGGLVILIPHLSDGSKIQQLSGMNREWIEKLDKLGGAFHPAENELGSHDKNVINKWQLYFSCVVNGRVRNSVYIDPELLKCVLSRMASEAKVNLALHCWGVKALMDEERITGVIFESKSGRMAALAGIVIDASGDGDIFTSAGAEYELSSNLELRNSMMALVFRVGGVDYIKFAEFRNNNTEKWQQIIKDIKDITGFAVLPLPSQRNDIVWINNWIPKRNCLDFQDLTYVEQRVREIMLPVLNYLQKNTPGFASSFIIDTAQQIGTRGSRRLSGEYKVTIQDLKEGKKHNDKIAIIPSIDPNKIEPLIEFPYRALVPKEINGLLVAGRSFSSDIQSNDLINLIPHCVAMGEAAGCAAAIALESGKEVRDVDTKVLQNILKKQGVYLGD
ncbi:MAG: FAD-dependent oxidoreductase [Spirochaetes bacterium]|nr:FAD-dependent oxidoreductase [Spirochaetota bacterium]